MQNVLSSKSRMDRVVADIVFDFSVKPRLSSERGNAILVASSIYEACKYFSLFQKTPFRGKCAVVTSYNPQTGDITKEETGANTETDKQFIYNTYTELLKDVEAEPSMTKTEAYEERAKTLFIEEPANMKLLVVVDKLLTGFDAPPCTYLYIDKSMQDHGLFQAICRVNRLDGIRIAAPERMAIDKIRIFAISKLEWIKRHQATFKRQERESPREYIDRESHYLWARRYLLKVVESDTQRGVELGHRTMFLYVPQNADLAKRKALVSHFYREQLRATVPSLLAKWQPLIGARADRFFVRSMKTKWGSCNPRTHTIRLNTELAKKPQHCLEYVVVHELVHMVESRHGAKFVKVMDGLIPEWRDHRDELNWQPLSYQEWNSLPV